MAETEKKTKKGIAWWKVLLIWAGVLLVLGAVLCVVLYRFLDVYEQTRPEAVMEEMLAGTSTEDFLSMAKENVNFELTEFESPQELYEEYTEQIDTGKTLSYRILREGENAGQNRPELSDLTGGQAGAGSSDDEQIYIVRSGAYNICNVRLEEYGDEVGFGRRKWRVASVEAADLRNILPSVNVEIEYLPGEENNFTLNGITVPEKYRTEQGVEIPDLNEIEKNRENPPTFDKAVIGPIYSDVVVADADGKVLPCEKEEDGVLLFVSSFPKYSIKVSSPEDSNVYIDDVKLSLKDAEPDDGLFEGLVDEYIGNGLYRTATWDYKDFYEEPEVRGESIYPDGKLSEIPKNEGEICFLHDDPEPEDGERYLAAKNFFEAYMNYSAYSYNGGSFSRLLSLILPGTDLYNYVGSSRAAMIWASATKTEYKNLTYGNFHSIGDKCFVCTVSYDADMTANSWYERYSYELKNSYELVFVKKNDVWYAAKMSVLSGE